MTGLILSLRNDKGNHIWSWWFEAKNLQTVLDTNHAIFNYYERDDEYSKEKMDGLLENSSVIETLIKEIDKETKNE